MVYNWNKKYNANEQKREAKRNGESGKMFVKQGAK